MCSFTSTCNELCLLLLSKYFRIIYGGTIHTKEVLWSLLWLLKRNWNQRVWKSCILAKLSPLGIENAEVGAQRPQISWLPWVMEPCCAAEPWMRAEFFFIPGPCSFHYYQQLGWCLVARLNLNIWMHMYVTKAVSLLGPSFRLVQ